MEFHESVGTKDHTSVVFSTKSSKGSLAQSPGGAWHVRAPVEAVSKPALTLCPHCHLCLWQVLQGLYSEVRFVSQGRSDLNERVKASQQVSHFPTSYNALRALQSVKESSG